jgi:hypothetical protein
LLKDRHLLEENLTKTLPKIKTKKKIISDIKNHLASQYSIVDTQMWINDPENQLNNLDIRELILFTEQVYLKTGDSSINIDEFFNPTEIKEARQFSATAIQSDDIITLPYTIPNVLQLSSEEYVCILDASEINKLMKSNLLFYNMDIQREAKVVRRKSKVIVSPTINVKSVNEITKNLLEGKQFPSELKFNCAVNSSDTGNELTYDAKHMELTIQKSTRIDILDGMHRIKGITNAFEISPDIKQRFTVSITNYTTRSAQLAQAQIAKANKFSQQRIQELEQSRLSDMVVKQLKDSDLKISQSNRISGDYIVSYNIMSDTIDQVFNIKNRGEAADVGEFLTDFFNFLLSTVDVDNMYTLKENSLILENSMFIGHIILAQKMYSKEIKAREIRKIIKSVDFSKDNPLWVEIGVLDSNKNLTTNARKAIKQYFQQINIDGDNDE